MTEASATIATLPYSRTNPFPATMQVNRRLSGPESEKDTRHFELDLTGWGLSFEVGDSVGVYPTNDPNLRGRNYSCSRRHRRVNKSPG